MSNLYGLIPFSLLYTGSEFPFKNLIWYTNFLFLQSLSIKYRSTKDQKCVKQQFLKFWIYSTFFYTGTFLEIYLKQNVAAIHNQIPLKIHEDAYYKTLRIIAIMETKSNLYSLILNIHWTKPASKNYLVIFCSYLQSAFSKDTANTIQTIFMGLLFFFFCYFKENHLKKIDF